MAVPPCTITDFIHRDWWWKHRGILILNLFLILPLLSAAVNGLDSSTLNGLQILPGWQEYFDRPQGKTLGLINSAEGIGALIGTPISPFCSDFVGRRATLALGSAIMLAGVLTQSLATTVHIFITARGIIGIGLAFSYNAAPLLISELAYPTQRGKITSVFNSLWYLGSIVSAWICLGAYTQAGDSEWSWRIPSLVQAGIPFLQMVLVWFIPESPRYMAAKGLESRAARILTQYHANGGDERDPLVVYEMAQIRHALKVEKGGAFSYWPCFSTPGNRRRMFTVMGIAIFSQWSGNGLVSYYIGMVLDGVGITSTFDQTVYKWWPSASALTGAMLVDKLGRRKVFIISNAGMLVSRNATAFSMWTLTTALFVESQNIAAARATVPLIFVYFFFYDFAYTPLLVTYTLEVLPYKIRARAWAITNMVLWSTVAFNEFVNPWALNALGWKYYLVYCGWLVIELIFVLLFVIETKGRTLEETSALFDGEKLPQDILESGEAAAKMTIGRQQLFAPDLRVRPEQHSDDNIFELKAAVQSGSSSSSWTSLKSQKNEFAVGFAV
ncbi:hypothetical protein BU15DRAFT_75185 [Melanogaster broomeanus]|nr:hypothetical protein BU15DRAFT_75185 [Melanogaster broomeanus]